MSDVQDDDRPGFNYTVSDEQLRVFGALTPTERLNWLEQMKEFTWKAATPEVRESWRRLRASRPPIHGEDWENAPWPSPSNSTTE